MGPSKELLRQRAIRLFTHLNLLFEQRERPPTRVDEYEKVYWLHEIVNEQAWFFASEGESWLSLKEPAPPVPVKIPDELIAWLDPKEVLDATLERPQLKNLIFDAGEQAAPPFGGEFAGGRREAFTQLLNESEIKAQLEAFVMDIWKPWAQSVRQAENLKKAFRDFYSIYQRQKRLGEAYEVVLGLGLLTWSTPSQAEISRHLLTFNIALDFDAETALIHLNPEAGRIVPQLELDMLAPQDLPSLEKFKEFEIRFANNSEVLFSDAQSVHHLLRDLAKIFSTAGHYQPHFEPHDGFPIQPHVTLAPALILRKRSAKPIRQMFKNILAHLKAGAVVPPGLMGFLGNGKKTGDVKPSAPVNGPDQELYFPLVANKEQRQIAHQIFTNSHLLVHGPPGTGKSHTIVNLICHLLATGKRVLVTSHTFRALRIIEKKCPPGIKDLCIFLLGDDARTLKNLSVSVRRIEEKFQRWKPAESKQEIAQLEDDIANVRKSHAGLVDEWQSSREKEYLEYPLMYGSYSGNLESMAQRLQKEAPLHGWIKEFIDTPSASSFPLDSAEISELLLWLNGQTTSPAGLSQSPAAELSDLPEPRELSAAIQRERALLQEMETHKDLRERREYDAFLKWEPESRNALLQSLERFLAIYDQNLRTGEAWLKTAAWYVLSGKAEICRELQAETRKTLDWLGPRKNMLNRRVTGLNGRHLPIVKFHTKKLLEHLEEGRGLGMGIFRSQIVKDCLYLIQEVRIDGNPCDQQATLQEFNDWLEVVETVVGLKRHWFRFVDIHSSPLADQVESYEKMIRLLEDVLTLENALKELRVVWSLKSLPTEPRWHDREDLGHLRDALAFCAIESELVALEAALDSQEKTLGESLARAKEAPGLQAALEALRKRDEKSYVQSHEAFSLFIKEKKKSEQRDAALEKLKTVWPKMHAELLRSAQKDVQSRREVAKRFETILDAWNWACVDYWLGEISQIGSRERLLGELADVEQRLQNLCELLAEKKAWNACFLRLDKDSLFHLQRWSEALQNLGKGTGKKALEYVREARTHFEECRNAFPAWVMPLHRVAENMSAIDDVPPFDIAIIDEASQSGAEGVVLPFLAGQVIVVGDDKQIGPDASGISKENLEHLRQKLVDDLPDVEAFRSGESYFDLTKKIFGTGIRLREHFRCMPEIIRFSNQAFYAEEPLLLMKTFTGKRLDPPVVNIYVTEGLLKGERSIINPPEACALVEQVKRCCQDPDYQGKTMGVVSLLGTAQARYIEELLVAQLGPAEMERRKILCGDAYAFQGDERDVMFLSMVSAPSSASAPQKRIGILTSQRDGRRFNVASSRAREQMWLFHSLKLEELNTKCLRHKLLAYCQKPGTEVISFGDLDLIALREKAKRAARQSETPPSPFRCWFQVDVFFEIVDHGFPVAPHYLLGGENVDLLVESSLGRVAVECEGQHIKEPRNSPAAFLRQRELEHCGWKFFRLPASQYYRDPKGATAALWKILEKAD